MTLTIPWYVIRGLTAGDIPLSLLCFQTNPSAASLEAQANRIDKTLLFGLIPIVVAFSFVVFVFYRARREAFFKQKETELKLNISEVEMKALRSQMNPHFIFNCLNSIHHYMQRNDIRLAGEYLIKFSQLIRHVLETSYLRMIPLADDLQALRLYIQLEQLRLDHSFNFEIITTKVTDTNNIQIPPLLIQPFVENSIWHGLNHRGPGGTIRIELSIEGDVVKCVIDDNGKEGSEKEHYDLSNAVKKTSLGMSLIQERLEVINKLNGVKARFLLSDIRDSENQKNGKRVELYLPFED